MDYITASATLVTNQHAIAATRYDSDPHTRIHRVLTDMEHPHCCWPRDWTGDQCGTAAHRPFSIVGGLPTPYRTPRLRLLCTLQWCWWDVRTSGVTLPSTRPGVAGVMAKSPLPKRRKTPMELPGEDRGGDLPPNREWERESGTRNIQEWKAKVLNKN